MKKRVFKSIISVSLVITVCCAALFTGVLYNYFTREHNKEIQNEASYIANGFKDGGVEYLAAVKNANDSTRITLISPDGTVIYDSEKDASQMENHLDREEVREAIKNGSGESSRYSSTLSEKTYYYALLLDDGNILRVSNVRYSSVTILWNMLQPILIVIAVAFVLSLLLASAVSKRTLKPINELDLDNPDDKNIAEELTPLIKKIRSQNSQIRNQIDELKRSQQEFKMITENMSEGLIIVDGRTDIISFNRSAAEIFGSDSIKENESAFVINRSEPFRNAVSNALSGNHSEQNIKMHGRVYNVFANPVVCDEKIMGAVIVILDITEKEQREELRREFTANVSHELKTPLTSISGFAEIIKDGIAKPEDIPHFADNIYNQSARLITLVGDIIKISQLDEGLPGAEKTEVDLLDVAKNNASVLKNSADFSGVKVIVEGESTFVTGVFDIIDEMVYNLCDNAIKYNKRGGKVKIFVKDKSITVSDTGIGIPKSSQLRVFERFYRVDKSHSKEIGGTGLGLSIVKHAAQFHNATISLESTENVGTTISISF